MAGIKELKTRIKSIGGTRKITRAMQMVSAAKMRKAQNSALSSRTYSSLAWELISRLGKIKLHDTGEMEKDTSSLSDQDLKEFGAELMASKLMNVFPNATKTAVIMISTNKGMVGGFNTNLINKFQEIQAVDNSLEAIAELLVMGKKVKDYAVRYNKHLVADFPKSDNWTPIENIYPLAKMATDLYLTGQYRQILVIYSHFVSTVTQIATTKRLLPFSEITNFPSAPEKDDEGQPMDDEQQIQIEERQDLPESSTSEYLFEPSPETVLKHLVPRIVESQIYQAVLESDASEHSARMVMMKNATEAAEELISDYTLTYNQLRQNKITTELSEITAGRIALE